MLQKSNTDAEFRVRRLVFFVPDEKTVDVTEAQRKRLITSTATRLFLRSPTPSPETFIEDVSGPTPGLPRGLPRGHAAS